MSSQRSQFMSGNGVAASDGGGAAAEESLETKQSMNQKEAITNQMIGIISSRLNALQTLANDRKLGLECDLKVNADYCSKMVPALQDPYESRSSAHSRAKTVSTTTLASNQAMMERLFGPDDKSRLRTQVLKKNKAELQKNEHRRNTRVHLEKQLQASVEGHITRSVDNYVYGSLTPPPSTPSDTSSSTTTTSSHSSLQSTTSISVNTKLLLLHTCERMRITHGKKNFKRFLLSDLSCTLFDDIFWLVFCHFFQRNSTASQRTLVDAVSTRYVKILSTLRTSNSDYIFRVYPYAVASGVCWGLHYLFPGSRHLYSSKFKNDVFLFVGQLLLGLRLCPVTVLNMRRQFFPDEMLDEASVGSKAKSQQSATSDGTGSSATSANTNVMPDLSALLPRLNGSQSTAAIPTNSTSQSLLKKAASESYLLKQSSSENSVDKILDLPTTTLYPQSNDGESGGGGGTDTDGSTGEYGTAPRQLRTHQMRKFFNASQLSPLMKEYLGAETKNVKKPSYLLRTTPLADCPVGGEDTFHKCYRRKGQKNFALDAQREQESCLRDIQRVQHDTRRDLSVLNETREIVLNSGKKALQAYCTLLLSKKSGAEGDENEG